MKRVFLNSVLGNTFEIKINSDERVSSLLGLSSEHFSKLGITLPAQDIKLIHRGMTLDTNKTITDSNIEDSDSLLLLFKIDQKTRKPLLNVTKPELNGEKKLSDSGKLNEKEGAENKKEEIKQEGELKVDNNNEIEKPKEKVEEDDNKKEEEIVEKKEGDEEVVEQQQQQPQQAQVPLQPQNIVPIYDEEDILGEIDGNIIMRNQEFSPDQLANLAAHIDWNEFPMPNADDLDNLMSMGFEKWRCQKALILNAFDPEAAVEWIILNIDNPNIDDPLSPLELARLLKAVQQGGAEERNTIETQMNEAIANNKCTYTVTGNRYAQQTWYFCYTCGFVDSEGICQACANVCHAGHTLSEPKGLEQGGAFFCDCGSNENCKCNK